jgi:alkenylglycerophosphocholine hydrolase
MRLKDFLKLYGIILMAHLAALYVNEPGGLLIRFTKPLLLLALLGYSLQKFGKQDVPYKSLLHRALLFALAGDVFLMFSGNWFFWGLGAFFITQLHYVALFRRLGGRIASVDFAVLAALLGFGFWVLMGLALPDMYWQVSIALYALTLLGMVWTAWLLRSTAEKPAFWSILAGAILFLISDALLAQGLFQTASQGMKIAVMATYGGAQLAIVVGVHMIFEKQLENTNAS